LEKEVLEREEFEKIVGANPKGKNSN